MNTGTYRSLILTTLLVTALIPISMQMTYASGLLHVSSSLGGTQEVKTFVIEISHHGFNHTSSKLAISVNEGDVVRLIFRYADSDLSSPNPHVIYLSGYDLETEPISPENPEAIVEFTAGQIGEFNFYCSIPCAGMSDLQLGYLIVVPTSGAQMETHMTLSVTKTLAEREELVVTANVIGHDEKPVAGIVVTFYLNTTFGLMKIDTATTDNSGTAKITYGGPTRERLEIVAVFSGTGNFGKSTAMVVVAVEARQVEHEAAGLPYSIGQNALPDLRAVGVPFESALMVVAVLGVIVGSIWAAYGVVVYELVGVWREDKRRTPTSTAPTPAMLWSSTALMRGLLFWLGFAAVGAVVGFAVMLIPVAPAQQLAVLFFVALLDTVLIQLAIRGRSKRPRLE